MPRALFIHIVQPAVSVTGEIRTGPACVRHLCAGQRGYQYHQVRTTPVGNEIKQCFGGMVVVFDAAGNGLTIPARKGLSTTVAIAYAKRSGVLG